MPTVLLVDDEQVFRAVEGTCLRRERARLVKALPNEVTAVARSSRPDLIVASISDATSRRSLRALCGDPEVSSIPIVVLDFRRPGVPRGGGADLEAERDAPVDLLAVTWEPGGGPDLAELDDRLEAALQRRLPWMLRVVDRIPVNLAVQCTGAGISGTLRTKDLSATGLFLKTGAPPAPGHRFGVRFRLPAQDADRPGAARESRGAPGVPIEATCEVVRRVLRGGRQGGLAEPEPDLIPGAGVRFVEMGARGRAALRRFVHSPPGPARGGPDREAAH